MFAEFVLEHFHDPKPDYISVQVKEINNILWIFQHKLPPEDPIVTNMCWHMDLYAKQKDKQSDCEPSALSKCWLSLIRQRKVTLVRGERQQTTIQGDRSSFTSFAFRFSLRDRRFLGLRDRFCLQTSPIRANPVVSSSVTLRSYSPWVVHVMENSSGLKDATGGPLRSGWILPSQTTTWCAGEHFSSTSSCQSTAAFWWMLMLNCIQVLSCRWAAFAPSYREQFY